ncbi:amidohydrolase [Desulfopila sp. IMCC35008]|uniref:amidohydrolase n=1 Tax=Desulfopila sp. IMCC35008 TaxID=2653858 RepID=UPI0013CF4C1B|nr:amidohydrolase [Desulfopila sp. IMCC35008]
MLSQELKKQLDVEVTKNLNRLETIYKQIHSNPELSCQEEQTAATVGAELNKLGLNVHTGIGGHGLVGVLENGSGPCLLIRADMDALPLRELTGLPYNSQVVSIDVNGNQIPVMHACGHDLHTTCLIGVASVLTALKAKWQGKVLFIGQPAEETIGGADLMMKAGIYDKFGRPDFALALHVDPFVAAGSVTLAPGVQSSCNHAVDLIVKGIGGHGASPHQTKDPILLAAHIITALQSIISREVNPSEMGLITVGAIHGGTKRNIIPEEVVMNLTIRAFDRNLADKLLEAVKRTACGIAQAHGLPEELWPVVELPETSFPPVINDPCLTETIKSVFCDLLGPDKVDLDTPSNGSEDFSFFGEYDPPVPLLMYHLGVTAPDRLEKAVDGGGKIAPVHDPRFYPDLHPSLATGVTTMSGAALHLLRKTTTQRDV